MNLQDALFNWLQIKWVSLARTDDQAAGETERFFSQILEEDHGLSDIRIVEDEELLTVQFIQNGSSGSRSFDRSLAVKLLDDINSNPKYNE